MSRNINSNDVADEGELTVKEYLESAAEASRRTRFITITMTVASVLVLVSVLNSTDAGWISLRIDALQRKKLYAVKKFPLLCACLDVAQHHCDTLTTKEKTDVQLTFFELEQLRKVKGDRDAENEAKARLQEICTEETARLNGFTEALIRSSAETKYTVRVPFFGAAFDVNDVGILAGVGLLVVLVLLRLSLRSLIINIRVGFKKAFDVNEEKDFYDVLASRQVFTFPPVADKRQEVVRMQGWIEKHWRKRWRGLATDEWSANRTKTLRFIPHLLSLVPTLFYGLQFYNDLNSSHYGFYLHSGRTWLLLILEGIFLGAIFVFGVWCITKWNELDKIWDYFEELIRTGKKLSPRDSEQMKS